MVAVKDPVMYEKAIRGIKKIEWKLVLEKELVHFDPDCLASGKEAIPHKVVLTRRMEVERTYCSLQSASRPKKFCL